MLPCGVGPLKTIWFAGEACLSHAACASLMAAAVADGSIRAGLPAPPLAAKSVTRAGVMPLLTSKSARYAASILWYGNTAGSPKPGSTDASSEQATLPGTRPAGKFMAVINSFVATQSALFALSGGCGGIPSPDSSKTGSVG